MIIDLQQVINSSLSLRVVSSLARRLPPWLGYRIADGFATRIAQRRDSTLVRAIRLNQWMASREALQGEALDQAVRDTLRYSAHSLFDLYHYNHNLDATRRLIVFDSSFESIARRAEFDRRGVVIAGLHLSSFDLVLQWLCKNGLKPLVLTIPNPRGGRQVEYEMRKRTGMNLVPASVGAFKQALKHLQRGGMVLTGIDRPIDKPQVCPRFFGRPAALPIHHIFLASKACVPVVITATYAQPDGKYHVYASDPIEMESCPDAAECTLRNAEKVLAVAETFIQRSPQQWSVPLPVWPDAMDQVPN
ncbi:MAG TPA: lysophospholipid acyltransferase family protein [Anaerolineales bacterium]|nr:lysophospholipid acyltransferase family protein [Anaerolineales bacterium]